MLSPRFCVRGRLRAVKRSAALKPAESVRSRKMVLWFRSSLQKLPFSATPVAVNKRLLKGMNLVAFGHFSASGTVNRLENNRTALTRADLTREKVLEAAEAVFARRGLSGTRVREIAEAAGVNVATLYIYFPSKQHLYEAVLERGVRPLIEMMSEFAAGERGREATERLFARVMRHLGTRPYFSRLVYLEAISEGRHLPELVDRWLRPVLEHALGEARRGTTSPPWEESLSPLVVTSFIHLTLGHFAIAPLFRQFFGSDPLSEEWIAQQTKFVATLIRQMFPQFGGDQKA